MSRKSTEGWAATGDKGLGRLAQVADSHSFGARIGPFVGGLYALFALFFAYQRVWPLAGAYLAGLLFDFWVFRQGRRYPDRFNPLVPWIWVVVFAQSLLSVWIVGTGAGFQYYLLATIPPGFASINRRLSLKLLQTGLIIVFFLACDIWFDHLRPVYAFSDQCLAALRHINTVGSCAMLAGGAYVQAQLVRESGDALRRIASTDVLTGLLNRRSFSEIAEREVARCQRTGHPLSLALGDIDFFKRINDGYGHAAGDHVLQVVANLLQGVLREYDCVARWGGEEFVVLLPDTDVATAAAVVERLRETIAGSHPSFEGAPIPVTMTLGLAQYSGDENWHAMVARADEALYRGKTHGRNRVEIG